MSVINPISVPRIFFAHTYHANRYHNRLECHKGCMEVTYLEKGSLNLKLGDIAYTAHEGDIICNLYREELSIASDQYHAHHTVFFFFDYTCLSDKADGLLIPPVFTPPDRHTQIKLCDIIDEIIRLHTLSPADTEADMQCAGLFLRLLAGISESAHSVGDGVHTGKSPYVRQALDYIYRHLDVPIHQQDVAQTLGITPEYLCSLFKNEMGIGLIGYVNRTKLEQIRTVMVREKLTVHAAAALYGFSDPNYVSRLYRQYFGIGLTAAVKAERNSQ